jgi:mannitol 2-dehydrogenase
VTASIDSIPVRADTLDALPASIVVPRYERAALRRSIVHIGVGGFHRAHLATYVNELCALGNIDWSIVGAGVLPGDVTMSEALTAQDFLYTLVARGADHTDVEVIGSIVDFIVAFDDQTSLIAAIAEPDTQIVSMTITEGGYPVDDLTGEFTQDRSLPAGVFRVLVAGLELRRQQGGPPLTVMSCDNIMVNGEVTKTATLGEAARVNSDLHEWILANVSFPNSMVDRITPVTTPSDTAWLERSHGIIDRWPVVAEPFRQWVIEDEFAGDRPPFEELDVILTADITPYELTKLRLLNAGHSCLAYLAALAGFDRVDAAMADPQLRMFVEQLLHLEAKPTLPVAPGIDLDVYIASLIERFSNPGVGDQIARLCLDGTSKFPKFLLPTVRAQLVADGPIEKSALALAGWCEYLVRSTQPDGHAPSPDPRLDTAVEYAVRSMERPEGFLEYDDVFGSDLRASARFTTAFATALTTLRRAGVRSAINAATPGAS